MSTITIDELTAFNDELAALVRARLPLELGLGATPDEAAAALGRINAALARRPGGEAASGEALEYFNPPLPAAYRSMVQIGLRTGDLHAALDSANRLAALENDTQFSTRSALVYPLIVCTLAIAGALAFASYAVPALENVYRDADLPWGLGLTIASELRAWRPALAALLIAACVYTAWQFWRTSRLAAGKPRGAIGRLSGAARAVEQQKYAAFAEAMAALTAANVSLEEGLPIAVGSCGDARLTEAARALATATAQGRELAGSAASGDLPPFLQWALLRSEPAVERSRALQMAADVYRESSQRTAARAAVVAPVLAGVALAGVVVLGYGLLLFAPLTELLHGLAMNQ
jgi:type II secretory pathway component PulF